MNCYVLNYSNIKLFYRHCSFNGGSFISQSSSLKILCLITVKPQVWGLQGCLTSIHWISYQEPSLCAYCDPLYKAANQVTYAYNKYTFKIHQNLIKLHYNVTETQMYWQFCHPSNASIEVNTSIKAPGLKRQFQYPVQVRGQGMAQTLHGLHFYQSSGGEKNTQTQSRRDSLSCCTWALSLRQACEHSCFSFGRHGDTGTH